MKRDRVFQVNLAIREAVAFYLIDDAPYLSVRGIGVVCPAVAVIYVRERAIVRTGRGDRVPGFGALAISRRGTGPACYDVVSCAFGYGVRFAVNVLPFGLWPFYAAKGMVRVDDFSYSCGAGGREDDVVSFLAHVGGYLGSNRYFGLSLTVYGGVTDRYFNDFEYRVGGLYVFFRHAVVLVYPCP